MRRFRPEQIALGVTPDARLDRVEPLTRRLIATAVGDLRALGLLDGYPDGKY